MAAVNRLHVVISVREALKDAIVGVGFENQSATVSPEFAKIVEIIKNTKKFSDQLIGLSMDEPSLKENFWSQTVTNNINFSKTTGVMFVVIDANFMQQTRMDVVVNGAYQSELMTIIPQVTGMVGSINTTPAGMIFNLTNTLMMRIGTRFPVIVFNMCPTYSGMFAGVNEIFSSTANMFHCVDMTVPGYSLQGAKAICNAYSHVLRGFPFFPPINLIKSGKSVSGNNYRLTDRLDLSPYVQKKTTSIVELVKATSELNQIWLNFTDAPLVGGIYVIQLMPTRNAADPNGIDGEGIGIMFNSFTNRVEIYSMWINENSLNVHCKKAFQRSDGRPLDFYVTYAVEDFTLAAVDPITETTVFQTCMSLDTIKRREFVKNISHEQTVLATMVYFDTDPMSSNITDMNYYGTRIVEIKNCVNVQETLAKYHNGASEMPYYQSSSTTLETYDYNQPSVYKTVMITRDNVGTVPQIPKSAEALMRYNNQWLETAESWFALHPTQRGESQVVINTLAAQLAEKINVNNMKENLAFNSAMIETKTPMSIIRVGDKVKVYTGSNKTLSAVMLGCSFELFVNSDCGSITGHNGIILHPMQIERDEKNYMVLIGTVVPEMVSMVIGAFECPDISTMVTEILIKENQYRLVVINHHLTLTKAQVVMNVDITHMMSSILAKGYGKTMYVGSIIGKDSVLRYTIMRETQIENVRVIRDEKGPNFTAVAHNANSANDSGAATRQSTGFIYPPYYSQ